MNYEKWDEILAPYQHAVEELKVKFKNIRKEFLTKGEYSPIEFVTGRTKKISSIISKANRLEAEDIEKEIEDITSKMKQEANILGYITESMPPTLIQHGLIDHLVPYQQSKMLEEKIWDICGRDKVRLDILADADHDDPLFNTPENVEELRKFLDKALKINR